MAKEFKMMSNAVYTADFYLRITGKFDVLYFNPYIRFQNFVSRCSNGENITFQDETNR